MARALTPTVAVPTVRTMSARGARRSTPAPSGLNVNANGTKNAGSVYFQVSIMVRKGFPPVIAAAANGDNAVGGLTSDRTA